MNISSEPLQNNVIRKSINGILNTTTMDIIEKVTFEEYESHWRKWLTYDTKNIVNLDKFPYASYTGGSTPSFGEFIVRHNNRRVRGSRNDFILTSILCRTYAKELVYLEDAPIKKNDCVIISLPFSGNGIKYKNMNYLLEQCNLLGVPVMLDASYFGISYGITYPLHYKCITDIVFSHSKNFSLTDARVGIRFTKELIDDGIVSNNFKGNLESLNYKNFYEDLLKKSIQSERKIYVTKPLSSRLI